jgi:hypothetical protein
MPNKCWNRNEGKTKKGNKLNKKRLKIPKEQSESVYGRTDNTIANTKVQKDKQQSTKHTHKIEDWVE